MTEKINIKAGEIKDIKFTITDNGVTLDVSEATLYFAVKQTKDDTGYLLEIEDEDFDKTSAESGIVFCPLDSTGFDAGDYIGELEITFSATSIVKSKDVRICVEKAIIGAAE